MHVHWREGDSREVVERLRRRAVTLANRGSVPFVRVPPTDRLPDRIVDLRVDDRHEPFEVWVRGPLWWAATMLGDRTLAVQARDVPFEDVAFTRVHDLEPYLAGRRDWIRRMRAEA
ncbi:hypothetical protein VD659_00755 [Herbiconiux sp. 11R-BC]|uniref:hypothetical protein n=1 Tax=Herbiconiux sp. 11R-BC TaxID=3111637 RepID=UPI003C0815D4